MLTFCKTTLKKKVNLTEQSQDAKKQKEIKIYLIADLKDFPRKPSVLSYKKSNQKENRTEGIKGTLMPIAFELQGGLFWVFTNC